VRRPNTTSLTRGRGYQSHPINSNPSVAAPAPRRPALPCARGHGRGRACAAADATLAAERAAGSQACTRSSPAPRPQPLRKLRRRTRSVERTCGHAAGRAAGDGELHAMGRRLSSRPCMRRAQLVHAGRRPPCVRRLAPCMHSCCVLCVGCSAEAGSHSSRPHSSPTLIVQERQSVSHMANGHSAGVDRPKPLANVCVRDLQIPEIGYQTCDIKSGPKAASINCLYYQLRGPLRYSGPNGLQAGQNVRQTQRRIKSQIIKTNTSAHFRRPKRRQYNIKTIIFTII
jgi:hypothetical protein